MAKSQDNDITFGMSGRLGKMISFRQIDGTTEGFRRPGKRKGKPTADQLAREARFTKASYYAKSVMADPVKFALYKPKAKGRRSVYVLALADAYNAPEIQLIKNENYHGQVGDTIFVSATDDFKLTGVKVSILDPNGVLIEEGNAVMQSITTDWIYTATVVRQQITGCKIRVAATDIPGNVTLKEMTL